MCPLADSLDHLGNVALELLLRNVGEGLSHTLESGVHVLGSLSVHSIEPLQIRVQIMAAIRAMKTAPLRG